MNNKKRLLLLVNPKAGKAAIKHHLLAVIEDFVRADYQVSVHTSLCAGDIERFARENAADYDIVVCSGGDGTMNELVNGVMRCGKTPLLGYIPAGTTNDFAASFSLPKTAQRAAQVITGGVPASFDVGRFGDRFFTYVAAFGALTEVSHQTPQETKNILGKTAYVLEGAARISGLKSYRVYIEHDGGALEDDAMLGVVSNSSYVAGLPIGRIVDSSMNDGLMEVFLIRSPSNILELAPAVNALILGEIDQRHIRVLRTKKLRISCDTALPWTLDGENGGEHKLASIENLPCALQIMVPKEIMMS